MAIPELGAKQLCPNCQAKFYDLNKRPAHCPKCETDFDPEDVVKSRRIRARAITPEAETDEDAEDQTKAKTSDDEDEEEEDDTVAPELDVVVADESLIVVEDEEEEGDPAKGPATDDVDLGVGEEEVLDDEDDDAVPFIDDEDEDDIEDEIDIAKDDED